MKKNFIRLASLGAIICAALSFTACAEVEPVDTVTPDKEISEGKKITVNFECSLPDEDEATRTEFHDKTIWWSVNDKIKYFEFGAFDGKAGLKSVESIIDNDTPVPQHSATLNFSAPDNINEAAFFSVFPSSSFINATTKNNIALPCLTLISTQNPSAISYDPNADLLVSKYVTADDLDLDANGKYIAELKYKRMVAIAKMMIKNLPSSNGVASVVFSAKKSGEDIEIAGSRLYDLVSGTASSITTENCTKDYAITLDYSGQNISAGEGTGMTAYFMCYPFELAGGDSFKVVVTTTAGEIFTREVTIPSGRSLEFKEGKGSVFTVDMSKAVEMIARYSNDGGATWSYTASIPEAISGITATTKEDGVVELLEDCVMDTYMTYAGKKLTFDGKHHTITIPANYGNTTPFWFQSSSDVTFVNVTIQGPGTDDVTKPRVFCSQASAITMGADCIVKDFKTSANGGAVYVYFGATFTMTSNAQIVNCHSTNTSYGGGAICAAGNVTIQDEAEISNCSSKYGGAVYVNGSTLTIMGGAISGCSVTGSGGAVYNSGEGIVNMSGGTISNCKATSNNGGAIYNPSGTVEMSGGTITGCSAKYGGGIDNRKNFSFTGGTITECSASTWGGGLYNTTDAAVATIDGGEISACTGGYGAGVSVYGGKFTLKSGSVSTDSGYAISKANNSTSTATINIDGGSVLSSANGGHALYVGTKGGTLNINGGTIESKGSSAYTVYNIQSEVNINDGSTLRTAYRVGYVEAGSININGGLLTGKDGIYVVSSTDEETKLIIKGGEMNFTGPDSDCAWFYTNSAEDEIITLDIQGGKFKSVSYVLSSTGDRTTEGKGMPAGSVKQISGGLFYAYTTAMSTMASNAGYKFSAAKNSDGYYEVIPK